MVHRGRRVPRAATLLAGCALAVAATWRLTSDLLRPVVAPLVRGRASQLAALSFEQVLEAGCAALLLGCMVWLTLGTVLAVASYAADELTPRGRTATALATLSERGCPPWLRRMVLTVIGVAVGVGVAGPALAGAPGSTDRPVAHDRDGTHSMTGLALPDRTVGSAPSPRSHRRAAAETMRTAVVRPGDSLWSIAAGLLPPTASDREVSDAWHRLHRANRSEVGPDPDLILPGTRLVVPDRLAPHREERP